MKRIGLVAAVVVGVNALALPQPAEAAGKCTSIQARCAVEVGGECNQDTGSWRYRGGQNMIAMFNACLSRQLKQNTDQSAATKPKATAKSDRRPPAGSPKRDSKDAAASAPPASATVPSVAPAAPPVQSTAVSLPSTLSCDPLSTSPEKNPAFKSKVLLTILGGVLTGERELKNGPGFEIYKGAINHLGEINLSGQGQRQDTQRSSSWTLTFNGRLNNADQTVLKGALVSHRGGGKRNCELEIGAPQSVRAGFDMANFAKPPADGAVSPVGLPPAPVPNASSEPPVAKLNPQAAPSVSIAETPPRPVAVASPEPPPVVKPRPQLDPKTTNLKIRLAAALGEDAAERIVYGDPGDVLILLNEASSAPHAIRVLSGEVKFQQDKAEVCRASAKEYGEPLDFYLQREIRKSFPALLFSNLLLTAKPCDTAAKADLIVIRRDGVDTIESLGFKAADAMARRQLSVLMVAPIAPYELQKASTLRLQKTNAEQLTTGSLAGIGAIAIQDGNRNAVCVSNAEDADFIQRVLSHMRSATIFESRWPEKPQILAATPDDIFINTKRNSCGFVVGDAALLGQMLKGLRRDAGMKDASAFVVSSVFVPKDEAEQIAASVAQQRSLIAAQAERDAADEAKKAEAARLAAERREIAELQRLQLAKTQDATQRALEDIKRKNDETARLEEIQRQRRVVATRGRTILDVFGARLRKHISSVTKEVKDLRRRAAIGDVPSAEEIRRQRIEAQDERIDREFPVWAKWLSERAKEEWEFSDPVMTLQDYGMSKWKDRPIEAISVKVEFPMLNKVIGDRKRYCVQFVWINDEEFSFYREPKSFECDLYKGAFQGWSIANGFESRWNASLP